MNAPAASEYDLHRYISGLLKAHGIKAEEFARACGMSRTTAYRYMKGMLEITPEVEAAFVRALRLTREECEQLRRLIALRTESGTLISLKYALDGFVFGDGRDVKPPADIKMCSSGGEWVSSRDICAQMQALTGMKGFTCSVRIVGCLFGEPLRQCSHILRLLLPKAENPDAEHLISFPESNRFRRVSALINIVPLMELGGYQAFFRYGGPGGLSGGFMRDSIHIRLSYARGGRRVNEYRELSFSRRGESVYAVHRNAAMHEYFINCFESAKRLHLTPLIGARDHNAFNQELADFESGGDICMIKPDPCYNAIPPEVYESLLSRMTDAEVLSLARSAADEDMDESRCRAVAGEIFEMLTKRNRIMRMHNNINVCSKPAMIRFAQTGLLADEAVKLPPFSLRERRDIFASMRDVCFAPDSLVRLYITRSDFFTGGMIISARRQGGAFVVCGGKRQGVSKNVFISDETLPGVIYAYCENQIPMYHSLSSAETVSFLNELIDMCSAQRSRTP